VKKIQSLKSTYNNDDKSILVELKSRRISSNKYNDTIINLSKIINCSDDKSYYFFFQFIDGLYCIKYDKDLFKSFSKKYNQSINFRKDVNRTELRDFIYIPIKNLTKV
jgi:hypothetical protein